MLCAKCCFPVLIFYDTTISRLMNWRLEVNSVLSLQVLVKKLRVSYCNLWFFIHYMLWCFTFSVKQIISNIRRKTVTVIIPRGKTCTKYLHLRQLGLQKHVLGLNSSHVTSSVILLLINIKTTMRGHVLVCDWCERRFCSLHLETQPGLEVIAAIIVIPGPYY